METIQKEELKYLKNLISQGEHQRLDFKFLISDSRKIARSLVAFANTDGGTLLVGVKDNGKISGIRSDEEIYMIDAAATLFCKPEIKYKLRLWEPAKDKQVLEVTIEPDPSVLWKSLSENGQWHVWLRSNDQNIMPGKIWELVWLKKNSVLSADIRFSRDEQLVFSHLLPARKYTFQKIIELTSLDIPKLEQMISDFVVLGLIDMEIEEQELVFTVIKKS